MIRGRFTHTLRPHGLTRSLLAELYDLEEDGYRLSNREANRLGKHPPATALRAVAAHANESLEELRGLARARNVTLSAPRALFLDTLRRMRDVVVVPFIDHDHAYRRALAVLRRGIDLVTLIGSAAHDECDDDLAAWCSRWLAGRTELVRAAAMELDWFAHHPAIARLPAPAL